MLAVYVERFDNEYIPIPLVSAVSFEESLGRETKWRRKGSKMVFRMVPCLFKEKAECLLTQYDYE